MMEKSFISVMLAALMFCVTCGQCFADSEALLDEADSYADENSYEQAEAIYKQVAADYGDTGGALMARAKLAALYIAWDRAADANVAYQQLFADFSEHQDLPEALYAVGKAYERKKSYGQAGELYRKIAQDYADGEFTRKARLRGAKTAVLSLIASADFAQAQSAVDKLAADFNGVAFGDDEEFPETLYDIAKKYTRAQNYEQAKEVYLRLRRQDPQSRYAKQAEFDIEGLSIFGLGHMAAETVFNSSVDSFISHFAGREYLPTALYKIAVQYHMKAGRLAEQGLAEQGKTCFRKSGMIFEKIVNGFSTFSNIAKVCSSAGDCFYKVGDYEKSVAYYQKVADDEPDYRYAWYAVFMVGRNYEFLKGSGVMDDAELEARIKAAYEQLLERYPDCRSVDYARSWLGLYEQRHGQEGK